MLKSLHGSHCLGCSSGFSACPSKSSFPTPLIWSHQASQRWHPPWLSINHSVAGRLTVPHLAFHISTLTHIFVMRSHLWRIPPTAIFRYLHHTHPPRLSTSLLPTKFSLKRYLLVSTSSVNPCSTHSAPEHLLPILPWASSSGLHGAGPPPAPFLCSLPKVPVLTEDALP